ncbi:MAG: glycoside hydrolase family 16 protein [Prolixibacteraceae bacterium]|nr:glycoside hydrolase family 16 protein [Prolixibacteraceae bacterium]
MKLIFWASITLFLLSASNTMAQTYNLVWEDNFDGELLNPAYWNIEQNEGIWNTGGNQELQYYRKENVSVGDDGEGNNCLILTAKEEDYKGYQFTSGRVNTKGKFAFKRGKLEAMIKIPDLANGLWPAFWTLGYTPTGWPDCGEIDVLEMGHAAGIAAGQQNSFIGSHMFWGPYPRDYGGEFVAPNDLSTGYFKHSVIWTESLISVYFNDAETPYFSMEITGDDTEEYRNFQHYILFNMAVGGSLPGIYDAAGITAPLPANMYIDWVKVYQQTGNEDFASTELEIFGTYGIFQEKSSTDMFLEAGYDLQVETVGTTTNNDETPVYGSDVLSYKLETGQDYEIKLSSVVSRNMTNYANGSIQFYMKTDSNDPFVVGISDTLNNEAFITLTSESEQDIARDNTWQAVSINLSGLDNNINLDALKEMLFIRGASSSESTISIDEVIYSETEPVSGIYGIYTNNPAITEKFEIDNINGHLYNWDNTVQFNDNIPAYEGEDVLSFISRGGAGWWGWGIFSDNPLNLTHFSEGYLHLSLNTQSTETFTIAIQGANDTQGEVLFQNGNDPYGFERNGTWHQLIIPMADLIAGGLDLSACGNILTMSGGTINGLAIDDVYLSESPEPMENLLVNSSEIRSLSPNYPDINYSSKTRMLEISGLKGDEIVSILNLSGQRVYSSSQHDKQIQFFLKDTQARALIIQLTTPKGVHVEKIIVY